MSLGSLRLATLIDELARAHRRAVPAPRGLPYLGLEHRTGTALHLLDGLAARGIFRKYELVLDVEAGLGATSRWLALRLGCEVIATVAAEDAAAAEMLARRAGVRSQVRMVAARPGALPVRPGRCTHVWAVESLARLPDADAALAEAWRALRRGGTLAVQELVASGTRSPPIAGWRFPSLEERLDGLRRAGFVDVETRDRTVEADERSAQIAVARARLLERMRADTVTAPLAAEREALAAALASGALRVVQMVGYRP